FCGTKSRLRGGIDEIIEGDSSDRSVGAPSEGCHRPAVLEFQGSDCSLLSHTGAALAGVAEKNRIEFRTQHLEAVPIAAELGEVDVAGRLVVLDPEETTVLLEEAVTLYAIKRAGELEHGNGRREKGFADVVAREPVSLADDDVEALARGEPGGHRPGWTAPSHEHAGSFGYHLATSFVAGRPTTVAALLFPVRAMRRRLNSWRSLACRLRVRAGGRDDHVDGQIGEPLREW